MIPSENSDSQYYESGFFHRLFFTWWLGLLKLGAQRPLSQDDLPPLPGEYKAENLVQRLEETWSQEIHIAATEARRPKLWKALLRVLPIKGYMKSVALRLTEMCMDYALVVLLCLFFKYLQSEKHTNPWHPLALVLGIGICSHMKAFCSHHKFYVNYTMGLQLKVVVIGKIYKKILSMTSSTINKTTAGHIINLLSNDAQSFDLFIDHLMHFSLLVLSFPTGVTLLWSLVGWQSLSGLGVLLIFVLWNFVTPFSYRKIQSQLKQATDQRLIVVKDVISGIRAVKMYGLERKFSDRIKTLRRKEIRFTTLKGIFYVIQGTQLFALPQIAVLVSITTLLYSNVHVNVVNIFTLVMLYNILCVEVTMCGNINVLGCLDGLISMKRIETLLLSSKPSWHGHETFGSKMLLNENNAKLQKRCTQQKFLSKYICRKGYSLLRCNDDSEFGEQPSYDDHKDIQPNVTLEKMSAGWFEDDDQCILHNISFTTEPNQLLMVTGPVGCGKSTLLMAILREIPLKSGNVSTHGKIAYVSQYPWIFTGTVRENILFGQTFDKHRYQRALDVCDLNKDASHFPKGDKSVTGQRGIRLSGGQRVRVSLARAVYSNADIYLLDDPLSALDIKVGQYVLEECICEELSNRIRILVTHQLEHLHRADNILLMKDGRVYAQDSYDQLSKEGLLGADFLQLDSKSGKVEERSEDEHESKANPLSSVANACRDMEEEEEDRLIGTVTWKVYWNYLRAGLHPLLLGCFASFVLFGQGAILAPNLWLSRIAKLSHDQQKSFASLGMLGLLVSVALVMCFAREWLLYNILVNASKNLHHKMILAVLKSPVLFLDTNPLGRIMNRFSKDIGCMENFLPRNFLETTTLCINALSVVLLALITNIWFVLAIIPLSVLVYWVFDRYLRAVRELKRMESIQCSPIYAHAMETITGMEVVRTSRMENNFLETMFRLQEENTKDVFVLISVGQWFSLNLTLLMATFLTLITGISWATSSHDSALAVMVLSLAAVGIGPALEFALSLFPEIESQMTSVERVLTYTNLPSEPGYDRNIQPPEDWPTDGALSLQNVSLAYFEGGPRVLRDISLDVKPAEKLGIAGRTGAGKSSLVASLFRMPDPEGGVLIDGVDLGTIHLQAARRSMAVITQDPVLFIGSLRQNLDPFDSLTDLQLWTALEEVQLKKKVHSLDGQLEYPIGEGGSGLSAGERQLSCLARALLEKCKILVLDEATANIDYQTDQMIQQTIRNKFTKCTVLTIAHRLNTIVDYDRVVVLEDGQVVEHGDPRLLAQEENSVFAKLRKA